MSLNLLDPKLIVLAAVVILIIAGLAWLYVRKRRNTTADLRQKFGPEYERAVMAHGSERKAEVKLADREKRVEKLNIRDLDPMEHERFSKRWESVQSRFVDSPKGAVAEADDLVSSLMKTRGYPVAVVPHMVKGGFVFGGKGGKGVATCRTANGWSAPAFITISGGSWGLQIGVEAVDVVMIIQNEKGMQRLLSSNFQVGADASAAAGPVGRHAEAGTDWKMDTEILTYSRAKGAFAGLTLEGASIRQDSDSRHAMYGPKVTTRALLLGKVPAPSEAKPFLAEIRGAKAQAVAEGKAEPKQKPITRTKTVTGCLQKGDEPSEFSITGEDGKTWGLRSVSVKLDQHVGHQVTVTGTAARETQAEEKKETKEGQVEKASSKEEYADLRVTTLKMVSNTCSK